MDELVNLLKMTELELKEYVYNYLVDRNMKPIKRDGFVYAKGKIPILLVAHLDTVFKVPEIILCDEKSQTMRANYGLGGDDRCGVFGILKILEELQPHVLFTEKEEIGGIGAKKAIAKLKRPNVKYIIELDRHGKNDCVFYDCGNLEFIKYIESFRFNTECGTFSDISLLGPAWDIAAVNLSCGYYNEHTSYEYINFKELVENLERVKIMLQKCSEINYFDYQELECLVFEENRDVSNILGREYDLLWEILGFSNNKKKRKRVLK